MVIQNTYRIPDWGFPRYMTSSFPHSWEMLAKAQSRMKMLTKLQEEAVAVGWKQLEAAGSGWKLVAFRCFWSRIPWDCEIFIQIHGISWVRLKIGTTKIPGQYHGISYWNGTLTEKLSESATTSHPLTLFDGRRLWRPLPAARVPSSFHSATAVLLP